MKIKDKNHKIRNKKIFNKLLILIVVSLLGYFLYKSFSPAGIQPVVENDNQNIDEVDNSVLCRRDTPYKTNPEFERGLSLLYQRIEEHSSDSTVQEELKPTIHTLLQIRNCLNIQYSESDNEDAEGFFVFDPDSTIENLQIFVNKKYSAYDDALTALLLAHEVTHAVQFIDSKIYNKTISCIDKEIESIRMEYRLLRSFTYAENTSIKSRITYETEGRSNLPASLQSKLVESSGLVGVIQLIDMQDKMLDVCSSENEKRSKDNWVNIFECAGEKEAKYIREYIVDNSFYQQQCDL
jgi:hypothetical protein